MFDILFNAKKAERHPLEMLFVAFFYASISILLGAWIFPEHASIVAVFFTVLSCFYVTQGVIKIEAVKEEFYDERKLLREHWKPLKLFVFLFIGIVLAFALWTFVLPSHQSAELFNIQQTVLNGINDEITGKAISPTDAFGIIFNNNIKVLMMSLLISLIYGAGAIFILTWNASIMGFVVGSVANNHGIISFPIALFKYFLHGLPEMLSYFVVILAGGIIYTAFLRGDFRKKVNSKRIIFDVFILFGIAIFLVVFSALIEVFVSPLL